MKYFFIDTLDQIYYAFHLFKDGEDVKFFTFSKSPFVFLERLGLPVEDLSKMKYAQFNKNFYDINGIIAGEDVYFFTKCWNIRLFRIIKLLSKTNSVYLYRRVPYEHKISHSLESKLIKFFVLIGCSVDIDMINESGHYIPMISDKFMSKNNIAEKYVDFSHPHKNIKEKFYPFVQDSDVLIVSSDLPHYGNVTEKEFLEFNNYLKEVLKDRSYMVKQHPNDTNQLCYPIDKKIPQYIPSEFLFDFKWKFVIGVESYTLAFARIHTNATIISCLDLLNIPSEIKEGYRQFLESECSGIKYPKTKEEFEEMIKIERT